MRHPAPPQAQLGARLGARPDLDLLGALDGRDRDPCSQRSLGDRDVELVVQLGSLATKLGMRCDMDGDVQAAGWSATGSGLALGGQANLVTLVDAGGGRHSKPLPPPRSSLPPP